MVCLITVLLTLLLFLFASWEYILNSCHEEFRKTSGLQSCWDPQICTTHCGSWFKEPWCCAFVNLNPLSFSLDYRPPPMMPPNRGGGPVGGGGSSSSSTSRTTTTRSPPYYTTPRPLLTTSPGQRYRTTTTIRQAILVPAGGSSSDNNQIPDTNQKAGGRSPPVQVPPAAPQPPALPPQDFCNPRVTADISWPRTQQGQMAKQPCPVGTLGKEAARVGGEQNVKRK